MNPNMSDDECNFAGSTTKELPFTGKYTHSPITQGTGQCAYCGEGNKRIVCILNGVFCCRDCWNTLAKTRRDAVVLRKKAKRLLAKLRELCPDLDVSLSMNGAESLVESLERFISEPVSSDEEESDD